MWVAPVTRLSVAGSVVDILAANADFFYDDQRAFTDLLAQGPNGAKVHSLRLSQRVRAVAYRDGDFLRLISLHPDHDSAYER